MTAGVDFIVAKILEEAARQGVSLSEVERQILYFEESEDTPAKMIELTQTFERDYDDSAYERKIAGLLKSAYKRTRVTEKDIWASSLKAVRDSDGYLGVIVDQADLRAPGDAWWLIASGIVVFAVMMSFVFGLDWLLGHPASKDEFTFYVWLAALGAGVGYSVARWILGADAVDDFIDKVIRTITFGRMGDPD